MMGPVLFLVDENLVDALMVKGKWANASCCNIFHTEEATQIKINFIIDFQSFFQI